MIFTKREDRSKRRNEWSTVCKEAKENEDPIEHYAYKILGRTPWYEQIFEDYDEKESEMKRHMDQAIAAYLKDNEIWVRQPRKKSLKELEAAKRESRRLMKEIRRENKLDDKLKEMTPTRILDKKVSKLRSMCCCTGESLRNGELCDICKLTKGVDSYMMNLFKEAAEE
jgi:hypothetical protein